MGAVRLRGHEGEAVQGGRPLHRPWRVVVREAGAGAQDTGRHPGRQDIDTFFNDLVRWDFFCCKPDYAIGRSVEVLSGS